MWIASNVFLLIQLKSIVDYAKFAVKSNPLIKANSFSIEDISLARAVIKFWQEDGISP